MAIGDRNISSLHHLRPIRRALQHLGSWVVRQVSNTSVPDTTCGFRAFTREAALRMTIVSEFSYTLESIIQSGKRRMAITHVPIATNQKTRESRLFDSVTSYIKKSAATIIRVYAMYEPLKIFTYIGSVVFGAGFLISLRFLYFYLNGLGQGHLQSLILSAVAHDRRVPGAADRPRGRRHLRQPETHRRPALPDPHDGARTARRDAGPPILAPRGGALTARGESPAAFDRHASRRATVARRSNTPGISLLARCPGRPRLWFSGPHCDAGLHRGLLGLNG